MNTYSSLNADKRLSISMSLKENVVESFDSFFFQGKPLETSFYDMKRIETSESPLVDSDPNAIFFLQLTLDNEQHLHQRLCYDFISLIGDLGGV